MEVKVEKPKSYIREMHITVPYADYENEKARIAQSYKNAAEIPGFRKGKAPLSLVTAKFKTEIEKEARENIMKGAVSQAVREQNLNPITYAEIADFSEAKETDSVTFIARFQVIPDFELSLEGLNTSYKPSPVSKAAVTKVLHELVDKYTTLKPVSRPSQPGDSIEFDYAVYDVTGKEVDAAQGMTADSAEDRGDGSLEGLLVGVKTGQLIEADISYPATFPILEFHGQDIHIRLQIKEVKEKLIPAIDDEFARTLGLESLKELRESVRKQLEQEQELHSLAEARNKLVDKLLQNNNFDVPEALLRHYSRQDGETRSEDEQSKVLEFAERKARLNIILDKISEQKQLKVHEDEISSFLEAEASRESVDPQKLRAYLMQTGKIHDIIAMFKREKAFAELEKEFLKKD